MASEIRPGAVVRTPEQLAAFPVDAILTDPTGDAWQLCMATDGAKVARVVGDADTYTLDEIDDPWWPFTVRWLPQAPGAPRELHQRRPRLSLPLRTRVAAGGER